MKLLSKDLVTDAYHIDIMKELFKILDERDRRRLPVRALANFHGCDTFICDVKMDISYATSFQCFDDMLKGMLNMDDAVVHIYYGDEDEVT